MDLNECIFSIYFRKSFQTTNFLVRKKGVGQSFTWSNEVWYRWNWFIANISAKRVLIGISFFLNFLFYIWLSGELSPATHPYELSDNAHGWVHLHFHCNKLNVPWNRLISKHRWPNNFTYYMTWLDWKIKHLFWLFALPGAVFRQVFFERWTFQYS